MHGSGSLTKYWACAGEEFKVRGIELRQHSTPDWVRNLQQTGLELLADGGRVQGLPSLATQRSVLMHYRKELERLKAGDIPLSSLVVSRRTSKELADYRVKNLTYGALMRAHERGYVVPPGGKVRYVVVDSSSTEPLQRVRLVEELEISNEYLSGCSVHYGELAERAIWALLAPFGWTTEQIQNDGRQPSLLEFHSS